MHTPPWRSSTRRLAFVRLKGWRRHESDNIVRLVKLSPSLIAPQFDLDAIFEALEGRQRKRMRAQKLSGSSLERFSVSGPEIGGMSDVFHLGATTTRSSTRILRLLRRREFHARPRKCPVGGLTNWTVMALSCLHPYFAPGDTNVFTGPFC
jgi:hypothetical protein